MPCKPPAGVTMRPRLTAICYNIGGVTQECYDLFKHWLQTRCSADVVILTETHWGLGKEDGRWTIPGWIVLTTADERSRYSGVGVFLRQKTVPLRGRNGYRLDTWQIATRALRD